MDGSGRICRELITTTDLPVAVGAAVRLLRWCTVSVRIERPRLRRARSLATRAAELRDETNRRVRTRQAARHLDRGRAPVPAVSHRGRNAKAALHAAGIEPTLWLMKESVVRALGR